jgi:hypothetical protein
VAINLDGNTGSSDENLCCATGNVTITVDGSTYSVNFDLTFGSKKMTGNYTGPVPNN